jgi:hypothetical protein
VRTTSIAFRVVLIVGIAAAFIFFGWRGYSRIIAAQQDEVFNHLAIDMGSIELSKPVFLLYTIKNGGSSTIRRHQTTCVFNKIMDSTRAAFVIAPTGVIGRWDDSPISAGGDAHTGRCETEFMKFSAPVVCADVTLKVTYELEIQPNKQRTKSLRFVATQGNGPHWYQESPNSPGNYCDGAANVR